MVGEIELRRSTVSATVLIQERFAGILRSHFGRHCVELGPSPDGRVRVRVAAPTPLMIAQQLAGWGGLVEVEESSAVRAQLARLGAELVERNGARAEQPSSRHDSV